MGFSIKTFLPRSLFGRSLLILAAPIILIQVISTYIFFDRHWSKVTSRLAFAVAGEIAVVAKYIENNPGYDIGLINGYTAKNLGLVIFYDPAARISRASRDATFKTTLIAGALYQELEKQLGYPFAIELENQDRWVVVKVQVQGGVLSVTVPQRRLFLSSARIFLLWMAGISVILLSVAVLFMRNQIRPIHRLAVAAERFGRGLDVPAFRPAGAQEVRRAAQAFLDMKERIQRQIQQRTAMLAGVSHDLRTPLTRMKLQVAMMDKNADSQALISDIADMERMIDAYLAFASGEAGESPVRTDLKDMLERLVSNATRQGKAVELSCAVELSAIVRPVALERCLDNVLGNACKYAGKVWVEASRPDSEHVLITVDDDGPGIPPDQYDEVFRPFVRLEPSRNSSTGGVGLGLPIAQDIVHSHGGRIWLEQSPRKGLRVNILLPI